MWSLIWYVKNVDDTCLVQYVTGAVGNEMYSIVKDDKASTYATLSRGVER